MNEFSYSVIHPDECGVSVQTLVALFSRNESPVPIRYDVCEGFEIGLNDNEQRHRDLSTLTRLKMRFLPHPTLG